MKQFDQSFLEEQQKAQRATLTPSKQLDGIKQQRPGSWVLPSARYATS
jgi:hypothetical protein